MLILVLCTPGFGPHGSEVDNQKKYTPNFKGSYLLPQKCRRELKPKAKYGIIYFVVLYALENVKSALFRTYSHTGLRCQ